MTSSIRSRAKPIISRLLDTPVSRLSDTMRLAEDLGADSLDAVELMMALELEFDIEIPEDLVDRVSTVGDVLTLLEAHITECSR